MLHEIILIGFYLLILLYSVILHEISHGFAAYKLGDLTAKYAGRLTLNPKSHIDPIGSVIVPMTMLMLSGFQFAFGWAKPVPYNPFNFQKCQKYGPILVALAGPATNILIAFIAVFIAKFISLSEMTKLTIMENSRNWERAAEMVSGSIGAIAYELLLLVIFWNVLLAIFNMIPIPPLDGSKLLYAILPIDIKTQITLEQYGLFIFIFIVVFFSGPISFLLSTGIEFFFRMTLSL